MNSEMMEALESIEREKGIKIEIMLEALANALVTAYKRMPNAAEEALVEIDVETGDIRVIAQELDEEGHVVREWDDTPNDFGRIAAWGPAASERATSSAVSKSTSSSTHIETSPIRSASSPRSSALVKR